MAVPEGYVSLGIIGFTDKGQYDSEVTYMQNDLVHKDNAIWKCKIDSTTGITPDENDNWTIFIQSQTDLLGISAVDTSGVIGNAGEVVVSQTLLDAIANRVMTQLFEKTHVINNGFTTEEGYALDARQANPDIEDSLANQLQKTNSNLRGLQYYEDPQSCMDGIYEWIMSSPINTFVAANISCNYSSGGDISGNLSGGRFQLIGYRGNNYATVMAMSYWAGKPLLTANIENDVWKNRFIKFITISDLPAKIYGTETEYVVVGINDSGLYISMNKNTNVLAFQDNGVLRRYDLTSLKLP